MTLENIAFDSSLKLKKGNSGITLNVTDCREEGGSTTGEILPLLINGHTIEEYQTIYHSVVDSMVSTASGQPHPYSLELGLRIKQHLWEKLC
ncbi:hypothetical protein SRHO_G00308690 [Serrasalmus rhombeus]